MTIIDNSMTKPKLGAVMVVQNDEETIERSVLSFYDDVEAIAVSTDPKRGWSGVPITPDRTIEIIQSLDKDNKIDILQGDFCHSSDPMENETKQRQMTADWLASKIDVLDWICQIDADEEFLDFRLVAEHAAKLPKWCRGIKWQWVQIFNTLDDGRVLAVTDEAGNISLAAFPFAHRPFGRLVVARLPAIVPFALTRQTLRVNEVLLRTNGFTDFISVFDGESNPAGLCLHYTFGKSEKRISEKLKTWGHAHDFDTDAFFELWKRSKTDWHDIRNFHPQSGTMWPALKAFTMEELRQAIQ